jgi:hypothetical protein
MNQWLALAMLVLVVARGAAADDYVIEPAQKDHWAWKVPVRAPLPSVKDSAWVRDPVDAFVLARLEAAGLSPAAPATRQQLIRRVTFDLIGLPPTPEDIDRFVADAAPDAYARLIERLLSSPQYGARWGRHWLDLARFAESNGYEHDEARPDAWRYRDYVIRSFNADKPYDRFIREQLAGDELDPEEPDALVATAFNLLGPDMTDSSDEAQRRQNTLNDMTDTAALAFLGLTMGCARCHDHKFEPIPQTDYYRLQAFFAPAAFRKDLHVASREQRATYEAENSAYQALVQPVLKELEQLEAPYRHRLRAAKLARLSEEAQAAHQTPKTDRTARQQELVQKTDRLIVVKQPELVKALDVADKARHQELRQQLKAFDPQKPSPLPVTLGLHDDPNRPAKTFMLAAGELSNPVAEVQPGFPIILAPDHRVEPARVETRSASTGRRTALATWIASPQNPLTARVLVNRLWQHHFGRGLVRTASDFGIRGERPTHPELLDWLAAEFVARGWSIKAMHRLMLLSATYQQSAAASPEALAKDPDNNLVSRMNRLRLEGEIIRDSLLTICGRLNLQMGGPGVFPPVPSEALKGTQGWSVSPDPRDHVRRSVYIFARRNLRFPFLEAFDLPDSNQSCPKRERSTTAPQALALLNAADVVEASRALAARVVETTQSPEDQIAHAFRLALGRWPTTTEREKARAFMGQSSFAELCRGLLNLNEFVYLD